MNRPSNETAMPQYPPPPIRGRRRGCLLWTLAIAFSLLAALFIVLAAAYAGWNAGVNDARAESTQGVQVEMQGQCELLRQNLADGKLGLAQSRIDWLRSQSSPSSCLLEIAPIATAAYLNAQPSPTQKPTQTPAPATWTPAPSWTPQPPATATRAEPTWSYDLEALLADALAELDQGDYPAAIQSLEAIVSIDDNFQRDSVRAMLLEALTAQALTLYRRFDLSEAIVLTERAENYGDIGELNYERYIADTFLIGQRNKTANPAEAVRRFSEIVYQHNPNYMNGLVVGELQDALGYYGDALLLAGDACRALEQYGSALALQPVRNLVSPAALRSKQTDAAQACGSSTSDAAGSAAIAPVGTTQPIGARGG